MTREPGLDRQKLSLTRSRYCKAGQRTQQVTQPVSQPDCEASCVIEPQLSHRTVPWANKMNAHTVQSRATLVR